VALIRPDVLVLAAGGVVGEGWMTGVLRGLTESTGIDFRTVETLVGTSAGSIVAASLAAGREPRSPGRMSRHQAEPAPTRSSSPLRTVARGAAAVSASLAPLALAAGAPAGALARRTVLARVPRGRRSLTQLRAEVDAWGARFDGRLRICTVDLATGRRVVFGAPGAPPATVAEAVEASCAVPGVFRPVDIGGTTYVDGGAWSITNLDVAPVGRDAHVLVLSVAGGRPQASAVGILRAAARSAVAVEAAAVRARGAHVKVIGPDAQASTAFGANLLDPRAAKPALEAGYRQGLSLGD
jgi:NTE family protein